MIQLYRWSGSTKLWNGLKWASCLTSNLNRKRSESELYRLNWQGYKPRSCWVASPSHSIKSSNFSTFSTSQNPQKNVKCQDVEDSPSPTYPFSSKNALFPVLEFKVSPKFSRKSLHGSTEIEKGNKNQKQSEKVVSTWRSSLMLVSGKECSRFDRRLLYCGWAGST